MKPFGSRLRAGRCSCCTHDKNTRGRETAVVKKEIIEMTNETCWEVRVSPHGISCAIDCYDTAKILNEQYNDDSLKDSEK